MGEFWTEMEEFRTERGKDETEYFIERCILLGQGEQKTLARVRKHWVETVE
jgi:hypothetical protein